MKIQKYIQSISGIFSKDQLRDNIRSIAKELETTTIPAYHTHLTMMRTWSFKSQEMKDKINDFNHMANGKTGNIIVSISATLDTASENLRIMERFFEKTYNEDTSTTALTYVKAQVQQFIDAVYFVMNYSRKFLSYAVICETAQYAESGVDIGTSLAPAEIKWINDNFAAFVLALNSVGTPSNSVPKMLAEIPDIIVTEDNVEVLTHDLGEKKVDPFKTGIIPVFMNPFYMIGLRVAEWQAKRYKAAVEELKLLQMRRLNLEKLADGKPDVGLKKQIDYMASRIQEANYQLSKMEGV